MTADSRPLQAWGLRRRMNEAIRDINDRFRVDFAQPLEALDSVGARAFAATDLSVAERRVYALVQERGVPCRGNVLAGLLEEPVPWLLNPLNLHIGPMPTPAGEVERMVTIVEAPTGIALSGHWQEGNISIDKFVKQTFLRGAVKALMALSDKNLTHRAIRPDNIFMSPDPEIGVVLGECFSSPAGAGQDDVYAPLPRAIADPDARGEGDESADLFALGVTLLTLFTGKTPGEGRSRQEMYHARISQGSFWAYAGGREMPGAITTVLRNLLNDDPTERWSLNDLHYWIEGQTPRKLSGFSNWSLSRPVRFLGQTYSERRLLADVLSRNVKEAAQYLRERDYPAWIQQVLATENFTERMVRLLGTVPDPDDRVKGSDDALVARYCMFLDPVGPVRYRGITVPLDGFGQALAAAHAAGDTLRIEVINELFSSSLITQLVEISEEHNPLAQAVFHEIAPAVRVAKSKAPGLGPERLLYDLNPSLPCLASKCGNHWVNTIAAAMQALDESLGADTTGGGIFDQHFMAFCASKDRSLEGAFEAMGRAANDPNRAAMLSLELLAEMQRKHKVGALPNLCESASKKLRPLIEALRNNRKREAVRAQIAEYAGSGDIRGLARMLALSKLQADDKEGFRKARARFAALRREREYLERGIQASDPKAESYGYFGAMAVGGVVLSLSVIIFAVGI